jgi:hypothetical protein
VDVGGDMNVLGNVNMNISNSGEHYPHFDEHS